MDWKEIFKKQDMSIKGTKHTKGGQKSTFVPIVPIVDRGRKLKKENQPTFVPCVPFVDKGRKLKKISQYTNPIRILPNTAKNLKNKSSVQKVQNIQKAEPENKLTPPTAKSAKRGFDSFGSTLGGHVREKKVPASRAKKRPRQKIRLVTRMMVEAWRVGRAWILEHLGKLEVAGWTRHELLRAGRFRYPCGTWGPAFTGRWTQEGVKIGIEASGAITFTWTDTAGRAVRQRAARISTTSKTN